jgi:hypothetical protein
MTEHPQHPFDAVGTVCPVVGCGEPRATITAVETYEGRRRKKRGRWATWRRTRLSCVCAAGHKYHAGIEGWNHDDEETA